MEDTKASKMCVYSREEGGEKKKKISGYCFVCNSQVYFKNNIEFL